MGFCFGAGAPSDVRAVAGLPATRLTVSDVQFAVVLLFVTITFFACGSPAWAQTSAKPQTQILRGTVLPQNKTKFAMPTANNWLVALRRPAKSKIVQRLDFSSFRRGFKPPAAVARPTVRLRYASLGGIRLPQAKPRRRVSKPAGRMVKWLAYPGCVPRPLKKILDTVARRFGSLTVNSTHRSQRHNREVGGAKHSYHLKCQAVDFRIRRNIRATVAFLKRQSQIGGLKHYGGGRFHIDTGPRRTW